MDEAKEAEIARVRGFLLHYAIPAPPILPSCLRDTSIRFSFCFLHCSSSGCLLFQFSFTDTRFSFKDERISGGGWIGESLAEKTGLKPATSLNGFRARAS